MDTKDVSLFLAIARIGSISRTAEQLFMSQSTVTTRLQRLERTLGYALFERVPSGVKLTPEGQKIVPLAEQIERLEQQMERPDADDLRVLRVMSGRAFVSTDVPECLARFLRRENVNFQVRMGLYDEMKDALLANQVDICFLGEPIYHPNIRLIEYAPDAIDLIVPKHHYFTHRFEGIEALATEPFIAFGRPAAPFRLRIMNELARHHVYPKIKVELDSIDGVKAMVAHGLGISMLPRRTLHDALAKGYVVISLNRPEWTRPTYVAHPESLTGDPMLERFLEVTADFYSRLPS